MMVIGDQFAGMEITDADVDQIEVVGDLIRYIQTADAGGDDKAPLW
jgi:acyl carrier protein